MNSYVRNDVPPLKTPKSHYSVFGLVDCVLSNNYAKGFGTINYTGYPVSNCLFKANVVSGAGGAINIDNGNSSTTYGSPMIMDCVFEENVASNGGGAVYANLNNTKKAPMFTNCVFRGNAGRSTNIANGGGAVRCYQDLTETHVRFFACQFVSNFVTEADVGGGAAYNGYYYGCSFVDNVASNGNGGGIYFSATGSGEVKNSTFAGNMAYGLTKGCLGGGVFAVQASIPALVDCVFTNNFAYGSGGGVYRGYCTNCTFVGNRARTSAAALGGNYPDPYDVNTPLEGTAVNCTFRRNFRKDNTGRDSSLHTEYQGGDVTNIRLENCDLSDGSGSFYRCSMVNCTIHDYTNSNALANGIFGEESWVTNCLITHCRMVNQPMFFRSHYYPTAKNVWYRGRDRGVWVNCTFADNVLQKGYGMFGYPNWVDASVTEHASNPCDFLNCIFFNNAYSDGTPADISGQQKNGLGVWGITYNHCLYSADDGTLAEAGAPLWTDHGGNLVGLDPCFVKERSAKYGVDPYSLRLNSPVLGKGNPSPFAAGDVDFTGVSPRLREGKVDLGCYQCWLIPTGTMVIFR